MRFKIFFVLMMTLFVLAVFAQEEEVPTPISVGTFLGEITAENVSDRYSIEVIAGQQLIIRMLARESNIDSWLFLFDSAGNLIDDDDDSAEVGGRDAQIVFTASSTGLYIIEATRFQGAEDGTGGTVGAYELVVSLNSNDPLSLPPNFNFPFTEIQYEESLSSELSPRTRQRYYVLGSQQGDFVRIELNSEGNLDAEVQLFNEDLQVVSRLSESSPNQKVIFAAIPETAWYLVAITQQSGTGAFSIVPSFVSDTLLDEETIAEARFDENTDTHFFVINATINERILVNLTVKEGQNLLPRMSLEDLNRTVLDFSESSGSQSRVSVTVPRSGPYIVQVRNNGTGRSGAIQLQMRRVPVDTAKLRISDAEYNQSYEGFVSESSPIRYYRFSGKAGERVNLRMTATGAGNLLDPYLIIADANFSELIFNDNVSATRDAQINQFLLPVDGDYYILASRQGLAAGTTVGSYLLELTVGQIKLETGRITASLSWEGSADLNLFVRTPDGYSVSWANPTEPIGGSLQIDSNTGCETLTDQPVEHIFWPANLTQTAIDGDYIIWVWYQNACNNREPVSFSLNVAVDGVTVLSRSASQQNPLVLQYGERFESSIRIPLEGQALIVNDGQVNSPSPQQAESQGGDTLISVNVPQTGEINDAVFAQFYQFQGNAGDRIRISVETITGDLDPMVFLRTSLDLALAENDDISPDNKNSQLEYTLPETANYVIVVSRYGLRDGTSFGAYRLSWERIEAEE